MENPGMIAKNGMEEFCSSSHSPHDALYTNLLMVPVLVVLLSVTTPEADKNNIRCEVWFIGSG